MEKKRMYEESGNFAKLTFLFQWFISNYNEDRVKFYYYLISNILHFGSIIFIFVCVFFALDDLDSVILLVHHFMVYGAGTILFMYFDLQKKNFKILINDIPWSYDYGSEIVADFQDRIYKRIFTEVYKWLYYVAMYLPIYIIINFNFCSILDSVFFDRGLYLTWPFPFPKVTSNWFGYLSVLTWENLMLYQFAYAVFCALSFLHVLYFYMHAELKILHFSLQHIRERIDEKMIGTDQSEETRARVSEECIQHCVRHHIEIIRSYDIMKVTLRPIFTLMTVVAAVVFVCTGIISMVKSPGIQAKLIGISIVQYCYIFMFCRIGDNVSNMGYDVKFFAYSSDLLSLPIPCQKYLIIMIARASRPLSFETLLGDKVNKSYFMELVKGSYTYINMLHTMSD